MVVIGSGAGGAITAATLAEAGRHVLILEEGPTTAAGASVMHSPEAMRTLYRHAGLSPILAKSAIAFVEGRCVGGSTEVNSGFWHRPPATAIARWAQRYGVRDLAEDQLGEVLVDIERTLRPATSGGDLPPSSQVFGAGLRALGLPARETPRLQRGDPTRSQFESQTKASMSRTYLPRATAAGATLVSGCRARRLHHRDGRVAEVEVVFARKEGGSERRRIRARTVFVCGGAVQTPALLRRSGIKRRIGDSLRIQPMLKVAARFDDRLDAHASVMPVYQMRDPGCDFFFGGSVFTPGFLGMCLSDHWPENEPALEDWRQMGIYYTACRGSARGTVRVFPGTGEAIIRYPISRQDQLNLSMGMAKLCEVLFAGGSTRVYPGVRGVPSLRDPDDVRRLLASSGRHGIPVRRMSISTVHVTSSCPMGENLDHCPVDSFGKVRDFDNLHLADASIIPDAPGVNPQGTVMALALRNARHFLDRGGAG